MKDLILAAVVSVTLTLNSATVTAGASSDPIRFAALGDYGTNTSSEQAVADLIDTFTPHFIITTGDNSYGSTPIDDNIGKYYAAYIGSYTGSYGTGSDTNRFFPSLGNHDYTDGGGITAYLGYFTLPGVHYDAANSSGNERYYDFRVGPVHFFAVNSNIFEPDGISSSSTQATWLQQQLAASSAPWKLVYMHHPPYSSATRHGSEAVMQWPYEDWGASAVLAGHDHTYERIVRDDNGDGTMMPYFVTGLGGRTPYGFPTDGFVEGSEARYNAANGTMIIEATPQQIIFRFYSVAGSGTLIDSYTLSSCCAGIRGNMNADPGDNIDISDLTFLVAYLFRNSVPPPCFAEADVNGTAAIGVADLTYLVRYMFREGPPPISCF